MMWRSYLSLWENGQWPAVGLAILPWLWLIIIFDVVLRGFALWRSARREQKVWFIVLLILNTAGILPLIYLLLNRKNKRK